MQTAHTVIIFFALETFNVLMSKSIITCGDTLALLYPSEINKMNIQPGKAGVTEFPSSLHNL